MYLAARWFMKTTALLLSARIALACICVLGGSTPLARRVMMDLGSVRSYTRGMSFGSIHDSACMGAYVGMDGWRVE